MNLPYRLTLSALLLAASTCAFAQHTAADTDKSIDALLGDHVRFQHLMTTLQQDVATHDAAGVATLLRYPFTASINGKDVTMTIPPEFIQNYDNILTPAIADVIKNQRYEDLFVNFKGVMFGSGELWVAAICRDKSCTQSDPRIITIQNPNSPGKKKKKFPL